MKDTAAHIDFTRIREAITGRRVYQWQADELVDLVKKMTLPKDGEVTVAIAKQEALARLEDKQLIAGVESFLNWKKSLASPSIQVFNYTAITPIEGESSTTATSNVHYIEIDDVLAEIKRRVLGQ